MNLALFSGEGVAFLLRWLHVFFGIIWIGHLYYFNFTQTPFFGETDAATKTGAIRKLVPRALWWFRWGAMYTFLTGVAMLGYYFHTGGMELASTSYGVIILTGSLFATLMFLNVWLVIWPAQQVVIANAEATATGGQAIPGAADRGARAGVASRTNVLFSVGMLFSMLAARHLAVEVIPGQSNLTAYWALVFVVVGAIQFNALKGKLGPLATVKGVITSGFGLAAFLYAAMEILL